MQLRLRAVKNIYKVQNSSAAVWECAFVTESNCRSFWEWEWEPFGTILEAMLAVRKILR